MPTDPHRITPPPHSSHPRSRPRPTRMPWSKRKSTPRAQAYSASTSLQKYPTRELARTRPDANQQRKEAAAKGMQLNVDPSAPLTRKRHTPKRQHNTSCSHNERNPTSLAPPNLVDWQNGVHNPSSCTLMLFAPAKQTIPIGTAQQTVPCPNEAQKMATRCAPIAVRPPPPPAEDARHRRQKQYLCPQRRLHCHHPRSHP